MPCENTDIYVYICISETASSEPVVSELYVSGLMVSKTVFYNICADEIFRQSSAPSTGCVSR